jgi:hypothetical protein
MGTELPAEGFLRHRGLILTAAGGAVAEGGALTLFAPNARPVAPQVTALPSLAAYHDLRWLFTDSQPWLWFAVLVTVVLAARAALDTALLRLAWPRELPPPGLRPAFLSCAGLTLMAWVLLSPATTLAFGAAVLPFSWPFLAAFPVMLGIVALLGHGGVISAWWRRLPPARAVGWLLGSFAAATVGGAVITRLSTADALAVAALAGLVNARAWYGLAVLAARLPPRAHESAPARLVLNLPFAPIAAVTVLALVVGAARLLFTGTIQLPISPAGNAAASVASARGNPAAAAALSAGALAAAARSAVLVVGGWGSPCCDAANSLHARLPATPMKQFSYLGLTAAGRPVPSGAAADDLPLPELGDRIAAQVSALGKKAKRPVAIVAESEGTLGVYAMLARHPGLPVSAVVLLSPIVSPGQLTAPPGDGGPSVSGDALGELNRLVGGMSPYGPSGAQALISSVSEFGARYFADLVAAASGGPAGGPGRSASGGGGGLAGAGGKPIRVLAVVPLADAVTLPQCALPAGVIVVPDFHGGLLGDPAVLSMVSSFLAGRNVTPAGDGGLRAAAELITGAAVPWRMPDTDAACPFATR